MYNLYTYEKQLLKNEKEKKDLMKEKHLKKKRKKEIIKLTRNYNNRMNDFILTMCQNPILLYNQKNPYNNYTDIVNKKRSHFSFGDFKTDKQRIQSLEKENKLLKQYDEKRRSEETKRNITKIKNHRNFMIIQPKMRFNSRTKLENIIEIIKKKEENANIDIYNSYLMEELKKLKYNNIKKIKEYNTLIDKDKLNNKDIKQIIKILNENEQYENNNEYTLKNYIDWKYLGIVSNNNNRKKLQNSQHDFNYNNINQMLELIGNKNKNKNEEKKNEFECLVKDDFKTHFKGASQYISLKDDNTGLNNEFFLLKNNIQNNIQNSIKYNENKKIFPKKRSMSALKLNIGNKSLKDLFTDNKGKTEQFKKKSTRKKRPASVIQNKCLDTNYRYFINRNEYSIKDLSEKFKMKKMKMKELMNKEINNSLITHYTNKYATYSIIDSEVTNNNNLLIKNNLITGKEIDDDLKEKLTYLQNEITQAKRIRNKEKYKQFVKRFARSAFGFKKEEIMKKLEDFKQDKKSDFVVIDGKVFPKNEMKKIADMIFQKCNFYRKKSIYNDGILVKNNGKLMFTSGLSINDFSTKYNL